MRSVTLAAVAAAALGQSAAVEPGVLKGVFGNPTDGCYLWSISPSTGDNITIGETKVCDGIPSTFPAFSAYYPGSASLYVATTGSSISSVDLSNGATTTLAASTYNESDPFLGFVSLAADQTFVVSQYNVWQVSKGKLTSVLQYAFPPESLVVGAPAGGSNGAGRLFVHDEQTDALYIVDLGKLAVKNVHTGAKGVIDLQYDSGANTGGNERLIVAQGYKLAQYSLGTGKLKSIGSIPDGPGYPRVNALSPSGKTLAIIDFANVFTIDTVSGEVGPLFPFSKASRQMGFPAWVPA